MPPDPRLPSERAGPTFPPPSDTELDVTILMPCLNEERTLPQCIAWSHEALDQLSLRGLTGEVLIADNGSSDASVEVARELGARVVHCPVEGYGAALRFGSLSARGRYVIMGDADASYDFRDGVRMIERLEEGYELCMGSRFLGRIERGAMPWKNRYLGNPLLTGVLNLFFRSGLSDAHCGLRAFTKSAFLRINPTSVGMEYASEMVIKSALLRLPSTEVPVVLRRDGRDRPPHLKPFRDGWRHLRYLIMLSPAWLYLLPGALMMLLGSLVFSLLLSGPPGETVRWGSLWLGDHWMPLGMGLMACGHLSVLFALAATLVGVRHGYRRVTRTLALLYRLSRLEVQLLGAAAFCALGLVLVGDVALTWAGEAFGQLSMQRQMIAGATFLVLGAQSFFGAFLLSVIAGNESDLEKAVSDSVRRRRRESSVGA